MPCQRWWTTYLGFIVFIKVKDWLVFNCDDELAFHEVSYFLFWLAISPFLRVACYELNREMLNGCRVVWSSNWDVTFIYTPESIFIHSYWFYLCFSNWKEHCSTFFGTEAKLFICARSMIQLSISCCCVPRPPILVECLHFAVCRQVFLIVFLDSIVIVDECKCYIEVVFLLGDCKGLVKVVLLRRYDNVWIVVVKHHSELVGGKWNNEWQH